MAIPLITNWSVTPQNGQVGYFTLMNTWLFESTNVISSANTSITKMNEAIEYVNNIALNAINVITFDNIAQLKLNSDMGRVDVLGYYTKGDGGGGTFYWDSTSTETDNGGTIIQATGVTTGRWKRLYGSILDYKFFNPDNQNIIIGNNDNEIRSSDSVVAVTRNVDDSDTGNAHCYSDSANITRSGNIAYNSYDCRITVNGSNNYNHFAPFQNGLEYNSTGTLSILYGYVDVPTIKQGTITNRYGSYLADIAKEGGTVVNNYGLFIPELVNGTNNYAVYAQGNTPSRFGGEVTVKAISQASGESGTNIFNGAVSCGGVSYTGSLAGNGSISKSTAAGLLSRAITGTTYDYSVMNNGSTLYALAMPTGTNELRVFSTFSANTDNNVTLGAAARRWSTVYAGTGTINTSDDRLKTYLDIDEKETLIAKELKSLMKKFKFNDSIEEKGFDKARIHFGTSAQSVKEVFEKYGLNAFDYALLCYDEWEDEYETKVIKEAVIDEECNTIETMEVEKVLVQKAGNRYGIRYDELLCFIISAL